MTDVLLQEGGNPQTEHEFSEMIRSFLSSALKEGSPGTIPYLRFLTLYSQSFKMGFEKQRNEKFKVDCQTFDFSRLKKHNFLHISIQFN